MKVKISKYRENKQKVKVKISSDDVIDLRATLAHVIHPALVKFKLSTNSFPVIGDDAGLNDWHDILNKMIETFELIIANDINVDNLKKIHNGLELFSKYYLHLWI